MYVFFFVLLRLSQKREHHPIRQFLLILCQMRERKADEEEKELRRARAYLLASFIQLFVLGFCQCITRFFSFFSSSALVCAQLIQDVRARTLVFLFFSFLRFFFSSNGGSVGRVGR